ncbi:MAG: hypothetical protein ACREQ9_27560, partial [Candidatus Binatia bacterium]
LQTLEPLLSAASTDEGRGAMCAVLFELCQNVAVATDGHRLHRLEIEASGDWDFLVPRKAIELVETVRKAVRCPWMWAEFFEDSVLFRVGTFEISARYEESSFPAWEEVVPKKTPYELRVSKARLLEVLDQTAAALGERGTGIRLRRKGEALEIHGERPGVGELSSVIAAEGWKEGESIGLNLSYLYDAVRFAPSSEVTIGIQDAVSAIKVEDGPFLAVVMPMRLGEETKRSRRGVLPEAARPTRPPCGSIRRRGGSSTVSPGVPRWRIFARSRVIESFRCRPRSPSICSRPAYRGERSLCRATCCRRWRDGISLLPFGSLDPRKEVDRDR